MQLKIFSIITFLIFSFSFCQERKAEIKFDQKIIDYGAVEYNSDGKRIFKFTNVGEAPLVFNRISSSCGCTVPKRPEKPVEPGESGEIEVEYDTKRVGVFIKAVTINSNAINSNIVLRIKGEVLEEEEEEEEEEEKKL